MVGYNTLRTSEVEGVICNVEVFVYIDRFASFHTCATLSDLPPYISIKVWDRALSELFDCEAGIEVDGWRRPLHASQRGS